MKRRLIFECLAGIAILLSCGSAPSLTKTDDVQSLNFKEWCAAWELTCPDGAPGNVPNPDKPWTASQWHDAMAVFGAFYASPSSVVITKDEAASPDLTIVAHQYGADDLLSGLRARLDSMGFQKAQMSATGVSLEASAANYVGSSGLVTHNNAEVEVSVASDFHLDPKGLAIGPKNPTALERINEIFFADTNIVSWTGDNITVSGVPIDFLFEQALGMKFKMNTSNPKYQDALPAILPMVRWMTTGQRDLDIGEDGFAVLRAHMPSLIDDAEMAKSMTYILQRTTRALSTVATRPQKLMQVTGKSEFECKANNMMNMRFATQFGIKNVVPLGDDGVTMVVYGITASILGESASDRFALSRIDMTPTKMIIYNVPLIGTYTVDMTNPNNQTSKLTCGNES